MITSRQNSLIKEVKGLFDKKNRDESGLYLIEGKKSVLDAVDNGVEIKILLFTEKGFNNFPKTSFKYEILSDSVFDAITTEVSPQGVMAVAKKPDYELKAPTKSCILLDNVSDPSNVGAIIRTAAASDFTEVYLNNCADPYSPKSVRASMGGLFRVKTYIGTKNELLEVINLPLVVGDMDGENVFEFKKKENVCLVIGNEGHGVDESIMLRAKYVVKIPMLNDMESLNASVSAGILMYAISSKIKGEN